MDPFTIEGPQDHGWRPILQAADELSCTLSSVTTAAVALTLASPAAAFNVSNPRPVRSHHDQLVRSLAEYRLSSAISFAAALGARTPLVTISRFSSFLP